MRLAELSDRASTALIEALSLMTSVISGGRAVTGERGTRTVITRMPLNSLNVVLTSVRDPDADEVWRFAEDVASRGLPWSIQVRGIPSAVINDVAAQYGRLERKAVPLMSASISELRLGSRPPAPLRITRVGADRMNAYLETLTAGFQVPPGTFDQLRAPGFFDSAWGHAYLAEAEGEPVGTGYAVRDADHITLFNISTVPEYWSRGIGRLVTERILRDGNASGATLAVLQSSSDGRPLYETAGFKHIEVISARKRC